MWHMVITKAIARTVRPGITDTVIAQTFLALWPLFHYLLWQDVATEAVSSDAEWEAYMQANRAFADKVRQIYMPGDLIWVHDYHLLLVPGLIRSMLPDATVGLFVHTPFPSSEVFRCLPSAVFSLIWT